VRDFWENDCRALSAVLFDVMHPNRYPSQELCRVFLKQEMIHGLMLPREDTLLISGSCMARADHSTMRLGHANNHAAEQRL